MSQHPQRSRGHLRNMAVTAGGTFGSRVLGLVRQMVVSSFFGTTPVAGAFILAFQIPNLFRRLLGEGALTAALMPVMSKERSLGGKEQAFVFLNQVVRRILPVLLLISAAGIGLSLWIGTHWGQFAHLTRLDRVVDPNSNFELAAKLTAVCMPYMPMICLAALFTAALNMLGKFGLTALNAVWLNVAMIVGLGGFGYAFGRTPEQQVYWLCGGALVGGLLQLFVPVWELRRQGWRPNLTAPACSVSAWSDLKLLFLPAVVGAGVQQINLFATRFLAFSVDDRAITVYSLANLIVELPVGVFAVTISTVIFSALSAHAANGDLKALAADFAHGLRLIFAVNIAACAGIVALAEPIVRLLFQHGKFTAEDTALTVPVLMIFACTLPFYGVVGLCSRTLSAMKDTKTQMKFAIRDLCLNAMLAPVLGYYFKAPGLAGANLIAVIYQAYTLFRVVRRRDPHLAGQQVVKPLLQSVGAALLMGLFAAGGWRVVEHFFEGTRRGAALGLGVFIPLSVVLYFGLLKLLRYPEADEILAAVRRKLKL